MGMGVTGLYGAAGAGGAIERLVAQRLEQQKFEEAQRQALSREEAVKRQEALEGQRMMEDALNNQRQRDVQRQTMESIVAQRTAAQAELERKTQSEQTAAAFLDQQLADPHLDPEKRWALQYEKATGRPAPANTMRDQYAEAQLRATAAAERAHAPKPLTPQQARAIIAQSRAQSVRETGGIFDPERFYDIAYHALEVAGSGDPDFSPDVYLKDQKPGSQPAPGATPGAQPAAVPSAAPQPAAQPAAQQGPPPPGTLLTDAQIANAARVMGTDIPTAQRELAKRGYKVPGAVATAKPAAPAAKPAGRQPPHKWQRLPRAESLQRYGRTPGASAGF